MARFLAVAEAEAAEAAVAYEQASAGLGLRFLDELEKAYARIDQGPLRLPPWLAEGVPVGTRHALLRIFPFHVVFVLAPDPLIVAVAPYKRDPRSWRGRI